MIKRLLSILLVLTLLLTVFGSCKKAESDDSDKASGDTTADNTTEQVEGTGDSEVTEPPLNKDAKLKVWFSIYPEENQELQAIADEFTAETGVEVEIIDSNFFEIRQKYPIAAESAEGPDLLLIQNSDLGTLIEAKTLRPIDFVDQELADRFAPVAINAFKYDGKQYGIGYSADAYGIVYNKALINEVPKTWSEFLKKADELTIKDSKGTITQYGFMIDPTNYWFVYPLVERYGGYYFGKNPDGSFNPDDLGIANAGSIKAYEELLELKRKGLTTQTVEEDDSIVNQNFADGKLAMMIYALWFAGTYSENGIEYGYAPLPNNDDGTPSRPLGSVLGFAANAYSKNQREADAFLKYIMQDDKQQRLYEAANGKEAKNGQRNTLNNSVFQSDYVQSDSNLKSLAEIALTCQAFPSNPEAVVIWSYSEQAFDNIFYNNMPVADTLKELESNLKNDIATMRGGN